MSDHPISSLHATTRRDFLRTSAFGAAALALGGRLGAAQAKKKPMNVLFLCVDDLRPQLACYGVNYLSTPNLDRLAASGTLFERNYCQYPVCGPSRASLLSGLRPTATRFRKWNQRVDVDCPGILTLPQHFRENGYITERLGKVFHDLDDCKDAWSDGAWIPDGVLGGSPGAYALEANQALAREKEHGPAYESAPVADGVYGDGQISARTIEELKRLSAQDKPFFLAAGFLRPHLPFNAPDRYWALYDKEKLPIAANPKPPENVSKEFLTEFGELRNYRGIPKQGPLTEDQNRTLVQGYCASVSYMDAQIGAVLDEVDRLGLRDNTLIVFWADHGWQLGEHGFWCKHTLFEPSLRTPLMVSGPGVLKGQRSTGLVENLDIYPTLCELAGLPIPPHVQGRSFVAQLRKPGAPGKEAVFSRFDQGDSIKTDRYRYSEWRDKDGKVTARMLYDHKVDPGENKNIAEDPASREIVANLAKQLARQIG